MRKIGEIDQTLGARALEVANNLDSRIGRFEELLVGRAETVTTQIETRTRAAADALNARMEQLSEAIKVNSGEAERSLGQLALSATEAIRASAGDAERTLVGVSEEVARNFVGKADEIATPVSRRTNEMTTVLSEKSGGVLAAITQKSEQFTRDVTSATDQAVKAMEEKGFAFHAHDDGQQQRDFPHDQQCGRSSDQYRLPHDERTPRHRSKGDHAVEGDLDLDRQGNAGNAHYAARGHHRFVRAAARSQHHVAGSAQRRARKHGRTRKHPDAACFGIRHRDRTRSRTSTGDATGRVETNIANFRDITTHVITDLASWQDSLISTAVSLPRRSM